MNAPETRYAIPAIATQHAGGRCLAHIFIDCAPFAIIVPPRAEREIEAIAWLPKAKRIAGAGSLIDGLANTRDMAAAGSPLAQWASEKHIAGHDDWYIPSRIEALTIRANLCAPGEIYKPADDEGFSTDDWYWTSTQVEFDDGYAWVQDFDNGYQNDVPKSAERRAFVVRREPIR